MSRRLAVRAATAGGLAVALLLAGGVALGGDPEPAPVAGASTGVGGAAAPPGRLATDVASLEERVRRLPGDWTAWTALGGARLDEARATGDPGWYPAAEEAFRESLRVRPEGNADALAGLGALAAARHDFAQAVALGREAVATDPYDATAHGVLVDGLVETGAYDEAATVLQRMLDLSPTAPALARASYLRELHGDVPGAVAAMERSLATASRPEERAFALQHLGDLAFGAGDLDGAAARYAEGLRVDPESSGLLAGQARVAAARGDTAGAEATYRRLVDAEPRPELAAALGDLLAADGREAEAAEQYALVDAAVRLVEANGGTADLEVALLAADRGDTDRALAAAEREAARRSTIHTDEALAWALHRAGRSAEALPLAERSLRLGTRDAEMHHRLGMIRLALGDRAGARASLQEALALNPHFSPVAAAEARAALNDLGAG